MTAGENAGKEKEEEGVRDESVHHQGGRVTAEGNITLTFHISAL